MVSLVSHPWELFIVSLAGLYLIVELGLKLRMASAELDQERQSLVNAARNGMTVLLSFLLGFALPMTLPRYEQRWQLEVDEADSLATVEQRAELLGEPYRGRILELLREYVDARLEFAHETSEEGVQVSAARAKHLQNKMWQEIVAWTQKFPNLTIAPTIVQALGSVSDLAEQRLAAYERHLPAAVWLVLALIAILSCFVVGYSMRRRFVVTMLVLPLTVSIVFSLISELDNERTGFINIGQQSMERFQLELKTKAAEPR